MERPQKDKRKKPQKKKRPIPKIKVNNNTKQRQVVREVLVTNPSAASALAIGTNKTRNWEYYKGILSGFAKPYIILDGKTPPLPSAFRDFVQVHNLPWNFNVSPVYRDPNGYYSFYTEPDLENFFHIARPGSATASIKDEHETMIFNSPIDQGSWPSGAWIDFDHPLTTNDGSNVSAILSDALLGLHWSNEHGNFKDGSKVYNIGSIVTAGAPSFRIENGIETNCVFGFRVVILDANFTVLGTADSTLVTATPGAVTIYPIDTVQWGNNIVPFFSSAQYLRLQFKEIDSTVPQIGRGMKIEFWPGTLWTFGAPLVWETHSFLSLVNTENRSALQAQLDVSSHVRFGLYDATIKNGTATIAKGGFVTSAQLPGATSHDAFYQAPSAIFRFLNSRDVDASRLMNFDDGQHYFYKPEKLQDWEFKRTIQDALFADHDRGDLPRILSAIYAPQQLGTDAICQIKGWGHYELLTTDLSAQKDMCPGDAVQQAKFILNVMRHVPQFTENPSHIKTLLAGLKSAVTSDFAKKLLMDIAVGGVELMLA